MADPDSRIPKGILKNKYGSSSRENSAGDVSQHLGYPPPSMNYGGNVGSMPTWDPQLGIMGSLNKQMPVAPVPAPQHGMNMSISAGMDSLSIIRGIK